MLKQTSQAVTFAFILQLPTTTTSTHCPHAMSLNPHHCKQPRLPNDDNCPTNDCHHDNCPTNGHDHLTMTTTTHNKGDDQHTMTSTHENHTCSKDMGSYPSSILFTFHYLAFVSHDSPSILVSSSHVTINLLTSLPPLHLLLSSRCSIVAQTNRQVLLCIIST